MADTIIIGGGLSGLSAAYHLKTNYKIVESESRVGGLCKSDCIDNFVFDYTGHLLHIKNKYTDDLIKRLLGGNLQKLKRSAWIYSHNVLTPYPYQGNLFGLPSNVVLECLIGFIKSRYELKNMPVNNFEDWIRKYLGDGIADNFMIPYNQKLWTEHPSKLTTEWLGHFVPNPTLEEVIGGAISRVEKDWGYNPFFYYPKSGGIECLIDGFKNYIPEKNIFCNKKVSEIDLQKKIISFSDGSNESYKNIISSISLPILVDILKGAPNKIKTEALKLRSNSVININYGVNNNHLSDAHWIYFPEKDYIFYRIGFPSNFSKSLVPEGCSSIYTEISLPHSLSIANVDLQLIENKTHQDLIKAKILKENDEILCTHILNIKPAYVIYDKNLRNSREVILKYLQEKNILLIGRYGTWEYSAMEEAILQGRNAARIIDSVEEWS